MSGPRTYTEAEVAQAAYAIGGCPGGTEEDALIDVLFLGAVASFLDQKFVRASSWWTTENQEILLALRSGGSGFDQVIEHVALPMMSATWLCRFFHGAHPGLKDPRNALIELMDSLEELSMTAMDCCFVVQAYRETSVERRARLLAALAETSRKDRLWKPIQD